MVWWYGGKVALAASKPTTAPRVLLRWLWPRAVLYARIHTGAAVVVVVSCCPYVRSTNKCLTLGTEWFVSKDGTIAVKSSPALTSDFFRALMMRMRQTFNVGGTADNI